MLHEIWIYIGIQSAHNRQKWENKSFFLLRKKRKQMKNENENNKSLHFKSRKPFPYSDVTVYLRSGKAGTKIRPSHR